jgi:hypothetical protein
MTKLISPGMRRMFGARCSSHACLNDQLRTWSTFSSTASQIDYNLRLQNTEPARCACLSFHDEERPLS